MIGRKRLKLTTNVFDLWVFARVPAPRYLLLHTSQEKADRWFGGGRFWQIPGELFTESEDVVDALRRTAATVAVRPVALWTVEHCYPIFNRRFGALQLIPVFAAEVAEPSEVVLTWEHSDFGWFTADEVAERVHFRGLLEGLAWLREYVSEAATPHASFRLD